jgi:aspartate/methionine/tyrosine aminotransferase
MNSPMKKSKHRKSNISERVNGINYSAIRKAFSAGRAKGVIDLTIGQPDFDVPENIKKLAKSSIEIGHNKYTPTRGIVELRQAVSEYLSRTRGIQRDADEVVVTAGTTAGIFLTLLSIINPGDDVIIFEPYFVAYVEIVKLIGGKAVIVRTDGGFQPDITSLKKAITPKTKVIIINSPNNPTGAVYSKEKIHEIVSVAKKSNLYILSDEIYSSFVYDDADFFSPAKIYKKTILIDGLSKSKGMTGWRIGFVVGPKDILDAIEKTQQFISVCAPSAFQHAAVLALQGNMDSKILARYATARETLYQVLSKLYKTVKPQGAFYFFVETALSGEKTAEQLLKKGLAVVPGSAFGKFKNYIRISYALPPEKIKMVTRALHSIAADRTIKKHPK